MPDGVERRYNIKEHSSDVLSASECELDTIEQSVELIQSGVMSAETCLESREETTSIQERDKTRIDHTFKYLDNARCQTYRPERLGSIRWCPASFEDWTHICMPPGSGKLPSRPRVIVQTRRHRLKAGGACLMNKGEIISAPPADLCSDLHASFKLASVNSLSRQPAAALTLSEQT